MITFLSLHISQTFYVGNKMNYRDLLSIVLGIYHCIGPFITKENLAKLIFRTFVIQNMLVRECSFYRIRIKRFGYGEGEMQWNNSRVPTSYMECYLKYLYEIVRSDHTHVYSHCTLIYSII